MENKVYGKAYARIVVPQEVLAKASGTISRGVKEILLSEEGDLSFVLTDGQIVLLGNIKGAQGLPGIDGISPTVEIRKTENGHDVIITDKDGTNTFYVPDGTPGKDGYTPQKGIDYFDGKDGEPGKDGYTPIKGVDYFDGEPGKDGYTPVKGIDYFDGEPGKDGEDYVLTQADKEEIAAMIPGGGGGGSAEVTAESIKEALGYTPADEADIPTKTSELENDSGFITLNDIPESGGGEVTAESIKTALGYVPANEADIPEVPTKVSAFENDAGYAKQSDIPSVPTKTSDLTNDSGYITVKDIPAQPEVPVKSVFGRTGNVTAQKGDYTAEMVGARPNTWLPTPEEIGAKPASYSPNYEDVGAEKSGAVAEHNVDGGAHNDIRIVLNAVKASLEAFLDIDEPTFDQLSELIAKIQANAGTIEQLTNGKVNVADIVNNLTTNSSNKPLSAAQGVVLKGLIDSLDTLATGAKNAANEAKTAAQNAGTTATEAKNLANTANTNANSAKTTAQNASDKVDNLEERMDSGEFKGEDGAQGRRGTSLLLVTTTPSAYTTAVNGLTPAYRIALSTVKSQAKVDEVFVGDTVQRSYYLYPVIYVDASYAYCGARVSVRGAAGAAATIEVGSVTSGATASVENSGTTAAAVFDFVLPKGDKGDKGDPYTLTEADKAEIVQLVIESIGGNPIYGYIDDETKTVILKNAPDGTYTIGYINDDDTFVPIGSMKKDTNVYYTVTNNLTNCTTNNSATKVAQGESYSATITANSGYQLKSVSATMGGSAVTVTSGKINIASVTGNIVITAVAEAKAAEPTNFFEYNATNTTDWNIWINNARAGSDGTYRSDTYNNEYGTPVVTNYIAVKNGDIIEFGGFYHTNKNSVVYKSDKTVLQAAGLASLTSYLSDYTDPGGYKYSFKINNANVGYIRIGGYIHTAYGERYLKIKRNGAYL